MGTVAEPWGPGTVMVAVSCIMHGDGPPLSHTAKLLFVALVVRLNSKAQLLCKISRDRLGFRSR